MSYTKKMKELLKQIRREIEDTENWEELYGLDGELDHLSGMAIDRLVDLSPEGGE